MCKFADLRFTAHIVLRFADLLFVNSNIFGGHKTSADPQIHNFSPHNYKFSMPSFKFKDDF
jgi:hypothetical protein